MKNRKILVILSNRFATQNRPRFFEIQCKPDGTIIKEQKLQKKPGKPVYDEVWENDEGRKTLDDCNRIKRIYRHALEKSS